MADPDLDLDRPVLAAIRRIVHGVDSHSKKVERAAGITLPQLVVLSAVRTLGEVTTGRISAAASLSPATVTLILDKLESRGLVQRYRNTTDRRVVHARLTEKGAQALEAAPPLLHERFVSRFSQLDAARKSAILAALEEVADMMDAPPVAPSILPLDAGLAADEPLASQS